MTNTTTQHIRALLVNDGHEFAMIRKTDLAALMQVADTDPHQGRFLDPIGAHKAEIQRLNLANDGLLRLRFKADRNALKHGEERRRYMANNKALQARVDQQDFAFAGLTRQWEGQRRTIFDLFDALEASSNAEVALRCKLRRFKRKFPAVGALMDVAP